MKKGGEVMSEYVKMVGYILSIGAVLGLISYGIYLLIPDISPYLTDPGLLMVIIGLFGVFFIVIGLILERIKDSRNSE